MSAALAHCAAPLLTTPEPETLCEALNEALSNAKSSARIRQLDIERIRRKPDKIILGVKGDLAGGGLQRFGVRLFSTDVAEDRFAAAECGAAPSAAGPGVLYLPTLGGVAWLFPNDKKIAGLSDFFDRGVFSHEILPQIKTALADDRKCEFAIDVLRYVPEQSCTVELTLRYADGYSRRLIGKCASDDRGGVGFAALRALEGATLPTPKAIFYSPRHRLQFQERLDGAPANLGDFFGDSANGAAAMATLASVHRGAHHNLPARTFADLARELTLAAPAAANDSGALRAQCAASALARIAVTTQSAPVLLHGDPHMANFLIAQGKARLIDFDAARAGPPELDVGSLFAALAAAAFAANWDDASIARRLDALLAAYEHAAQRRLDRDALDWSLRAALLTERYYRSRRRAKSSDAARGRVISWAESSLLMKGARP